MPQDINKILEKANNLKHNFYTVIKVSKKLDDFNVSISDLSKVISSDLALTATILKHCNSAKYGFARKITTINDAISVIGFTALKTIIFTIVSKSSFSKDLKGYGLEEGDFWKNSISCAVYSRYIAELTDYEDPEQAFTAGLLRDVGKLILNEYVKENRKEIIKIVTEENIPFSEAEEKVLGLSHCQIGAIVAEKWKFPQVLIDSIKYHHNPEKAEIEQCEDMNLVRIVHLSDSLSVMLGYGIGKDGMLHDIDISSHTKLGFKAEPEDLELLISKIINLNSEINSMI